MGGAGGRGCSCSASAHVLSCCVLTERLQGQIGCRGSRGVFGYRCNPCRGRAVLHPSNYFGVCMLQVIVLSFTTIIGVMISTFMIVLGTGAIRFNE